MWQKLEVHYEPALHDPVLLVSVSTSLPQYQMLYSQARELAKFLLKKLEFKLFASAYMAALGAELYIRNDGSASLISNHFYHYAGERDIILFAGDSTPTTEHYEFAEMVLSLAQKLGVKEVISIGARWAEAPIDPLATPNVVGFASDEEGIRLLRENGVTIVGDEPALFFSNIIVGMAPLFGMRGFKVSVNHGEPKPHPKSVLAILNVLSKMLRINIDTSDLEAQTRLVANEIQRYRVIQADITPNNNKERKPANIYG